jgi:hypothetical protein
LGGVHVGLHVRVLDTIAASGMDFRGFASPEWFFS